MSQLQVEAEGATRATPDIVWALLADANAYADWGPWDDAGYRRGGDDSVHGVGAVRWFRYGRTTSVERVTEVEEGRRIAYTVIEGIPVRNYRAEIILTTIPEGTRVRWAASWDNTLIGRIVQRKLRSVYPQIMAGLVSTANERIAAS